MKLRLDGKSLRLRLSQKDVAHFRETGSIEDAIEFAPASRLVYTLESSLDVKEPRAGYENNSIRIQIPLSRARTWLDSDETGIAAIQPGAADLSLLIEKDFRCLHRQPGEEREDADAFPNPMSGDA